MYGNLLYNIIEQVENCGKTNKLLLVSQWNWSEGSLTSKNAVIAWIKKKDFGEIKMPTGNEVGANSEWIPGGKTAGGLSEGILDLSNPNIPKILYPF